MLSKAALLIGCTTYAGKKMQRGSFNFMASHEIYASAPKNWYVSPLQCDCFWLDMIVNPPQGSGVPDPIKGYFQDLKKRVEESLEKRFIYMYGSSKKIRLDTERPLSKSLFSRDISVNVFVGAERKRRRIRCDLTPLGIVDPKTCKVHSTDKFLTVSQDGERWVSTSIHDFLQMCAIDDIGLSTDIHYVGLTKNPHERPLNRQHRGYSDMVYGVGSDDNDFFLFVTVFKVMTSGAHSASGFNFFVSNSMTDEVAVQPEGHLIEGALIAYFDSPYQDEQGAGERAKLEAQLRRAKLERSIESVVIDFEVEGDSPYYRLRSRARSAANRHVFRCCLVNDKLCIEPLPESLDAATLFR